MNQEPNDLNQSNFNTEGNNGIHNNPPLNNQEFNNTFNPLPFNSQPQQMPNFQQPVIQMNTEQTISQPINNTFGSDNANNQNINSKPPKKLNINLIIVIAVVGVLAIVAFILLGGNNKFNKSDNDMANNSHNNSKSVAKYEGTKLTLFDNDDFKGINGEIRDVDINFNYIITTDDTLYDIGPQIEKKLVLPNPIHSILDNHVAEQTADLLVKNEDGSVSHISPYLSKVNYTINLENIIYADDINIITLEEGYLYNYTVEKNKTTNKSKITLYKERKDYNRESYDSNTKVTLEYLSGDSSIFFKIDNEIRQFENFLLSQNGWSSRKESTLSPSVGEREYLETKKNKKMLYYSEISKEIYVSEEKNTSIYYFATSSFKTIGDAIECYKEKGSEALCYESIKKELALPENYNVNNIKETRITSNHEKNAFNPLIIMNDMKVFYYNNGWRELEELSNLYKNNHIVKLITNKPYASTITVLCDDGYLYEYSTY